MFARHSAARCGRARLDHQPVLAADQAREPTKKSCIVGRRSVGFLDWLRHASVHVRFCYRRQKNWRMGYGAWPALSMLGKRTLYCPHRSWEDLQYIRLGPNSEHRPSKLASKKDSQRILLNNGLTIPRVADPVEIQMEWSEIRLKKVSIQLPDQEYSNERLKSKRSLETESDGSGFHVRMIHCDSENQPESPSSGLNN